MKTLKAIIPILEPWISFKKHYMSMTIITVFMLFAACESDDEVAFSNAINEVSISDIAGAWQATSAVVIAPHDIDILAAGAEISLIIHADGNFIFSLKYPEENSEHYSGMVYFDDKQLKVDFNEDPGDASFFISYVNDRPVISGEMALDLQANTNHYKGIMKFTMERS